MSKVVTFGEIILRLSSVGYDRLFQNNGMQATFGGGEANERLARRGYYDISEAYKSMHSI